MKHWNHPHLFRPRLLTRTIRRFFLKALPAIACCAGGNAHPADVAAPEQAERAVDGYRVSAAHGPYFFCDERVVEDRWLVERFVVPAERHTANPLLQREFPWEGTGPYTGGSAIRDPADGMFKLWYSVWNREAYERKLPFSYNVCYAESPDGIAWARPPLGVFDYKGSTQNNCIRLGTDKTQNIDVELNEWPERFPGRFLAMHNQKGGVFVSWSDDGKTFTRLHPQPAIAYHSDTDNNFVFDPSRQRWLLFCRPRAYAGYHKRRVAVELSGDLKTWTHDRTILIPTETEIPEYYGMTVFRRGDLFFGVLQPYDRTNGRLIAELATSGDGLHWTTLPEHQPFVEPGPPGAWDAGMVLLADKPIEVGDKLYFYYGGFHLPHDTTEENVASIGLLISDRDRLIGLRDMNEEGPGTILTRPFMAGSRSLVVNAQVEGSLRVEVRTDDGRTIEGWSLGQCDRLTAGGLDCEIRWQGRSLAELAGREIRLFFELDRTAVFTFDLVDTQ